MRVWTFGCSMTEYAWPTWADILINHCKEQGHQAENWGRSGAGNQFIIAKIMECHAKNTLGPDDYVLVCFSSFFRNDYYVQERGWYLPGRLQDNTVKHHKKKEIAYHIDPIHYAIRDCSSIASIKLALENLGVKFLFWFWNDHHIPVEEFASNDAATFDTVTLTFKELIRTDIPNLDGVVYRKFKFDSFYNEQSPAPEIHPLPSEHLKFVKDNLLDRLDWIDKDTFINTEKFVEDWENKIKSYNGSVALDTTGWKIERKNQWN